MKVTTWSSRPPSPNVPSALGGRTVPEAALNLQIAEPLTQVLKHREGVFDLDEGIQAFAVGKVVSSSSAQVVSMSGILLSQHCPPPLCS